MTHHKNITEGYQKTEMGVIPEDWKVKKFGDVMTGFTSGATPYRGRPEYYKGNIRWITSGELNYNVITDTIEKITEEAVRNTNLRILPKGTFLMAITGLEAEGTRGSCGIVGAESATNQSCMALFPTNELLTEYLYHYYVLNGDALALKYCQGTKQQSYTGSIVRLLPILLPPTVDEQAAIATALSDADNLISNLEELTAKKRDIKKGAMQRLLTGKERLPGFSDKWETKSLLELADNKKELFDDGDWIEAEFLADDGIRLIQTGNIGEGVFLDKQNKKYISKASFDLLRCKEVKEGDILICRLAEPAGRACIMPNIGESKIITAVDVTIFRPLSSIADRKYLINVFSTNQWFETVNEKCGGTTRTRIARGALGKIKIRLPPLSEQIAIAQILTDMDTEIKALEQKLVKYKLLKQGMMQNLLTGKIRLV